MSSRSLPAAFNELEPYLDWSLPTERERIVKREETPMEAIIKFHDAMLARLEAVISYLNQYPYSEMPDDAQNLCDMALSLVEISSLVEMYKYPELLKMMDCERFVSYE